MFVSSIYVDAVVNHMTGAERSGTGSAGSSFDGGSLSYPSVPFSGTDFTPRDLCSSASGAVIPAQNFPPFSSSPVAGQ
jgi:alpha-amylase